MFREFRGSFPSRRGAITLLVAHLLGSLLFMMSRSSGTNSAWAGLPLDDSWIHLVYARSLAERLAFHYNPGQWEAGMTSPLWCLLEAPLVRISLWTGFPAPVAAKLLGTLVAWGGSLVLFVLGRTLGGGTVVAYAAAILPALEPDLAFARVSGMEVWLAGGLTCLSLLFALHGGWFRAGVTLALGLWTRPEVALWALLLPLAAFLPSVGPGKERGLQRPAARSLARYLLPPMAAAGLFVTYCLVVTGRPLPNTAYAKWAPVAGWTADAWLTGAATHFIAGSAVFRFGGGLFLLAAAFRALLGKRRDLICLAAVCILYPLLFALIESRNYYFFHPNLSFAFHRYYLPVAFLPHLLAGIGAGFAIEALRRRGGSRDLLLVGLGTIGLFLAAAPLPGRMLGRIWLYSWNTRNIEELQGEAGDWLKSNSATGGTLALNDAGAIRYRSERRAVDLAGLNTHQLAGIEGVPASTWKLLEAQRVEWLAVLPFWYPEFERIAGIEKAKEFQAENYTLKNNAGWDRTVIYHVPGGVRAAMGAPLFVAEADRLLQRGAWDLARPKLREALACAPGDTAAMTRIRRLDALEEAARGRRAELEGRALRGPEALEAAELALRFGEEDASQAHFEAAYASLAGQDRVRAVTTRAQALAQRRKGDEALRLLRRAAAEDPNPLYLVQVGRLAMQGQRYRVAEQAYRRAISTARDQETRAFAVAGLVETAVASESRRLAEEAILQLSAVPIAPAQRARLEEQVRSLRRMPHGWD
ncbi:MAG: hypothetical protein IPK72_09995 [Candidatus Eisenbacteria bacterium]|nr:hypothetical protein [Candidatus Eisenbacteria bacterium]